MQGILWQCFGHAHGAWDVCIPHLTGYSITQTSFLPVNSTSVWSPFSHCPTKLHERLSLLFLRFRISRVSPHARVPTPTISTTSLAVSRPLGCPSRQVIAGGACKLPSETSDWGLTTRSNSSHTQINDSPPKAAFVNVTHVKDSAT